MVTTYTTWAESGGVGKTTFAMNLAAAHSRNGYRTLVIDLDTQDGGLTDHAGLLGEKQTTDRNNLRDHILGRAEGELEDIIHTHPEDEFDIIPTHARMRNLATKLQKMEDVNEDYGYNKSHQLRKLIEREGLHKYDVIIVDPPAKPSVELKNALYATRNIVSPVEVTPKGNTSVGGILDERKALENELEISIGVYGVVLNDVTEKSSITRKIREEIMEKQEVEFAAVEIRHREALLNGAWNAKMSAFSYGERKKGRLYDRERVTLQKFQYLADLITGDVDPEETSVSDLGEVVERPTEHRIAEQFKEKESTSGVQA